MELLLNLAWVLLVVPAFWLWRRGEGARAARTVTALQCLLALGCVVVLLFPVISATDDLHAMRAEMEESATSKRAVRQTSNDKCAAGMNRLQGPAVPVASMDWLLAPQGLMDVCASACTPLARPSKLHAGRAPPAFLFG
jgi:hypothetical protein